MAAETVFLMATVLAAAALQAATGVGFGVIAGPVLLLLIGDREPVFDHFDSGPHQHAFKFRHVVEKLLHLILSGEFHHAFNA